MPTAPARELTLLERDILAVKRRLEGARAAYVHSPNADKQAAVERLWRELDRLLDRLPRENVSGT